MGTVSAPVQCRGAVSFDTWKSLWPGYILRAMKNPEPHPHLPTMADIEPPFQILFVSRVVRDADFGFVKEIVGRARHGNPARGISGALLFDGEHFCELIEGGEATVRNLLSSIARDPRHADVTQLHVGPAGPGRALQGWVSGYCEASDLEAFIGAAGLRGAAALEAFISVVKRADVV